MKKLKISFYILALTLLACDEEKSISNTNSIINESNDFAICNQLLAESGCLGGEADYCLFGYKWGRDSIYSVRGYNALGPKSAGGIVSFSFQENNGLINTHAQIDLPSKSFDLLISCAKSEIRKALTEWESHANISFIELSENSDSDIRFFVADIRQSAVAYPNYQTSPCNSFSGNVVIQSKLKYNTCISFYSLALHEIGHSLGLGHVSTNNIMNGEKILELSSLQAGDKKGIQAIYGSKND